MMLYAAYSKCVCRPKIPSANLRFERTSQSPIFHVKKQVVYTGRDGRKVHLTVHMFFLFFHFLFVFFFLNSILESTIVEAWFFDPIITSKSSECSPAFSLLRYGWKLPVLKAITLSMRDHCYTPSGILITSKGKSAFQEDQLIYKTKDQMRLWKYVVGWVGCMGFSHIAGIVMVEFAHLKRNVVEKVPVWIALMATIGAEKFVVIKNCSIMKIILSFKLQFYIPP